jgi:hypothetical protein
MNVMAKQTINKSALVRDYLAKYPEKGPSAIAKQITEEKGIKLSGKFVATIKTKAKQSAGAAAMAPASVPAVPTAARKKPAPARAKAAPAPAPTSTGAAALSHHIANLKAAVQRLGKDEAKRIIDLF